MEYYRKVIFPLVTRMDAERAHDRTLQLLEWAQRFSIGRSLLGRMAGDVPDEPVVAFGLTFPNLLGVAAGFDKNARVFPGLATLGFGHIEVGTLTPRPQPGNPCPRIFRLPNDRAIVNRMGFPNEGVQAAAKRLRVMKGAAGPAILGVSLGKQKETALPDAAVDYVEVMKGVYDVADYLAVNVSSPNTPGLRELQHRAYLEQLLARLEEENQALSAARQSVTRPLLLKISPDLTWAELDEILELSVTYGIRGLIATNTTLARVGLNDARQSESGGLSGRPLADRSNEIIRYIYRQLGESMPVIGVGGVLTAEDAQAKLEAGACLVQLYTGLVFEGPTIAAKILRRLPYNVPGK
jgi:dihydroorotate dehydrogenase